MSRRHAENARPYIPAFAAQTALAMSYSVSAVSSQYISGTPSIPLRSVAFSLPHLAVLKFNDILAVERFFF